MGLGTNQQWLGDFLTQNPNPSVNAAPPLRRDTITNDVCESSAYSENNVKMATFLYIDGVSQCEFRL